MGWSAASRTIAIAAALALAAHPGAQAKPKPKPNTLLLGDLGDAKVWLMVDSVRQDEAGVRHGWTVLDYVALQTTQNIDYRSDASKFYVRCQTQQIALTNAIKFAGPMGGGANVFQVNAEPTPEPALEEYHAVHANTAEQVVANAICKQKIR